jgi:hypothetical protein
MSLEVMSPAGALAGDPCALSPQTGRGLRAAKTPFAAMVQWHLRSGYSSVGVLVPPGEPESIDHFL